MKDPKIAALFKDPEDPSKGRMTSCISGWTCYTVNMVKQIEYGLDKYYTNFDPGSCMLPSQVLLLRRNQSSHTIGHRLA